MATAMHEATQTAKSNSRTLFNPLVLLRRAWALNAPLTLLGVVMVGTLLAALAGLVVDHQVITGAPAWLKPAKFAISITIYCFTFVYLLQFVRGHQRLVAFVANVTAVALLVEMIIIVGQVIRGTTSHFNYSTPLDAALFMTMAGFITLVWVMALLLGVLLLRQRMPDPVWAWALRLSVLLALIGMGVAFLMTSPTAAQLAGAQAGKGLPISGAHSVGVADGGPGLPVLGWSTVAGDLRIPHFFGLHGLQVMLILGFLLTLPAARAMLSVGQRVALVWTAGLGYLGLIGLLTWQALRGQSIIAPDGLTLAAGGALLGAVVLATALIVVLGGGAKKAPENKIVPIGT
jgi:hypothetical protein